MVGSDQNSTLSEDEFVTWREVLTSQYAPALVLICLAVWLHAANSLIVATMLPSIVDEIGGAGLVGWSVSLYEIASVVAGAASALLTMRYGLRRPMCLAALTFALGCLLAAFAPNMPTMLLGRIFQGLGGGGLAAMSFVAMGLIFPRRYVARAMAAVSTFWGVSAFLGPMIGGFFVEYSNWRWGFGFFALQACALSLWIASRPDHGTKQIQAVTGLPWRRLMLLCLAVLSFSYGGVDVEWVQTSLCVLSGMICLALFLHLDRRAENDRLLPLETLDIQRPTGAALLMVLSLSFATIAITAFGPLLVMQIHGISALSAGYIVACSSIGWSTMAFLVSGLPEKYDRYMIAIGMVVTGTSILGFAYSVPNGPVWLIVLFSALEGAGFGMAWTFILRRATALADPKEVQRISGALPTVQRLGYAMGAAYTGIVANAVGFATMQTTEESASVAQWIFLGSLPFAAVGLVAMVAMVRRGAGDAPALSHQ